MLNKKGMTFVLIALVISVFAFGVVSAQRNPLSGVGGTFSSAVFDPIRSTFADWGQGDLSVNVAKYAVWALLAIFIYGIVAFVPFVKSLHGFMRGIFSVIVAFLSTAYLTPGNIYGLLASYSALGLVLGVGIPFIILLFFSIEMSKEGGSGGRIISKVAWMAFILLIFWKLVQGMFFLGAPGSRPIGIVEGFVYVGIILFAILWIWFLENAVVKAIFKEEISSAKQSLERNFENRRLAQKAALEKEAQALEEFSGGNTELDKIAANIRKAGSKK